MGRDKWFENKLDLRGVNAFLRRADRYEYLRHIKDKTLAETKVMHWLEIEGYYPHLETLPGTININEMFPCCRHELCVKADEILKDRFKEDIRVFGNKEFDELKKPEAFQEESVVDLNVDGGGRCRTCKQGYIYCECKPVLNRVIK